MISICLFTHCVIVSVLFMSLAYCNCDSTTNVKLWSLEYFKALQQRVFAAPLSITAYVNVLYPLTSTLTGTTPMYAPHRCTHHTWSSRLVGNVLLQPTTSLILMTPVSNRATADDASAYILLHDKLSLGQVLVICPLRKQLLHLSCSFSSFCRSPSGFARKALHILRNIQLLPHSLYLYAVLAGAAGLASCTTSVMARTFVGAFSVSRLFFLPRD